MLCDTAGQTKTPMMMLLVSQAHWYLKRKNLEQADYKISCEPHTGPLKTEVTTPYPKRSCAGQMPIWCTPAHCIGTVIRNQPNAWKSPDSIRRSERRTVQLMKSPELDNVDLVKATHRSRFYCHIDIEKGATPSIIQCLSAPVASKSNCP